MNIFKEQFKHVRGTFITDGHQCPSVNLCLKTYNNSIYYIMKRFLTELEWKWDFYFVIFLYNTNKVHRYDAYMKHKWGKRYTEM